MKKYVCFGVFPGIWLKEMVKKYVQHVHNIYAILDAN